MGPNICESNSERETRNAKCEAVTRNRNAKRETEKVSNLEVKKIGAAVASDAWSDAHSSAHARADDAQRENRLPEFSLFPLGPLPQGKQTKLGALSLWASSARA